MCGTVAGSALLDLRYKKGQDKGMPAPLKVFLILFGMLLVPRHSEIARNLACQGCLGYVRRLVSPPFSVFFGFYPFSLMELIQTCVLSLVVLKLSSIKALW